ncbi:Uncharacterized membrane protein HdeD, DUF308 family [Rhizobiales bacterium GAS113]|nr:Uncharacterized membrane protein HdeD, DUF308 family [Rhizobiales bacterium GAS113]
MSAGLARNWWAVGLRGVLAVLFGVAVLVLPPSTLASLVVMFGAYLAADGLFAILAATWAAQRDERWFLLIYEGAINIAVAGGVLAWQAVAIVPFFQLASVWAVVTGAMLLAAAHRLALSHGRGLLIAAGAVSAIWGLLVAAAGPSPDSTPSTPSLWLVAYAIFFGVTLLALGALLRWRHRRSMANVISGS